jgi:septum formation inhibitor MinC
LEVIMSQAPSAAFAESNEDRRVERPASVSLKGTTRGLEILISGTPSPAALGARLSELLAEAPGFFAGSQARVAIDGALPVGALACLEDVAARFALQLVEIGPAAGRRLRDVAPVAPAVAPVLPAIPPLPPTPPTPAARTVMPLASDDAPLPELAEGTGPIGEDAGAGTVEQDSSAALVSAATALVNAAMAMTGEPSGAALAAKFPTEAACKAASGPSTLSEAACKAASGPSELSEAACKAASGPSGPSEAACKAASGPSGLSEAACKAASGPSGLSDAACKAASGPSELSEAGGHAAAAVAAGDPGLLAALAAVLIASGADAAAAAAKADAAAAAAKAAAPSGPRLVIGPVRSGRIVDHVGHLIVIGDVNPGAEVRAEGSIIVLGRLRGVAHAAIGRDAGCIIALSLQPQQLRIGRMVARAGDADRPSGGAEIAYATGETIVVERFTGRLPSGLAASM